jgi:hypothetical protein
VELLGKLADKDRTIADNEEALASKDLVIAGRDMLVKMMQEEIERLGGTWKVPEDAWGEVEAKDDKGDEEESTSSSQGEEAAEEVIDKRLTEEYWEDILAMFAVRWSSDIVSEKCCILTGSVTSKVLLNSPHSIKTQIVLTVIFFVAELVADSSTMYVMDRWFGVPFLRLPRARVRTKKYWAEILTIALVIVSGTFFFYFAFWTSDELFSEKTVGNTTSTETECVWVSGCESDVCGGV